MKKNKVQYTLLVVSLLIVAFSPSITNAHEDGNGTVKKPHQGTFLGIGLGSSQSTFGQEEGSRTNMDDLGEGAMGGVSLGYAFSKSFALSLEGCGFGQDKDDSEEEWGLGAGILAATYHPAGKGFFLRAGAGIGGGEYIHPETQNRVELTERAAFLFSLGYDFKLNNSLTLGVALESMVIDAGEKDDSDHDFLGSSGLNIQFKWYL